MLLVNKSGRIYDIPDEVAEKYIVKETRNSREAVNEILGTLRRPDLASPQSVQTGCCNAYPNYCPNK